MSKHVAVVLCGCGRSDGSEITEAVSVLVHLSRAGAAYRCFALDEPQAGVVDHLTSKEAAGSRNQLVESARIARGDVTALDELRARDFDALVFPGGSGAAKNLCDFASRGADCRVHPKVERVVKDFHGARKPIGFICITPVIGARVLGEASGGPGCSVTLGADAQVARAVAKMGSTHVDKRVTEALVDENNRVITTPAYMCNARPHEVFDGIGALVNELLRLA
jgi:enhancing lycopene biosynthesis protein 2